LVINATIYLGAFDKIMQRFPKKEADEKRKSRGKVGTKMAKVSEKKAKRSGKVSEKKTFPFSCKISLRKQLQM
jgi:hypothetical protein